MPDVKVWIVVGNPLNPLHMIGTINSPEDMPKLLREAATQIEQQEAWWKEGTRDA